MIVVPATPELLERYGAPSCSMRAVCAVEEGEVLGYAGVVLARGAAWVVAHFSDAVRARPRTVVHAMRRVDAMIGVRRAYARADPEIAGSEIVLRHLRFHHVRGDLFEREA